MIKRILLILLVPVVMFSQEDQGIELPEFVITGERKVSIPTAKKKKVKPISILSKEFFTPIKSPEEFKLSEISKPEIIDTNITLKQSPYVGSLFLGAGINTLPIGEFNFNTGSKHMLFSTNVFGYDEKEYVDNAGLNVSGGNIGTDFFISSNSTFLPGARIRLKGTYLRDEYKLFGSRFPNQQRQTQNGNVAIGLINEYSSYINYGFGIDMNSFSAEKDNDLKENIVKGEGYFKIFFERFSVKATGQILTHEYSTNILAKNSESFIHTNAKANLSPLKNLDVSIGISYAELGSENHFTPQVSLSAKLEKGFSVFAEYAPESEFISTKGFLSQNRFYNMNSINRLLTKHTSKIKAAVKYEYFKFFEISGGFGTMNSDNFPYFTFLNGEHRLLTANDVSNVNLFLNLFFHLGPYGRLYGSFNFDEFTFNNDNYVPNRPRYYSDIIYGVNLHEKFEVESKLSTKSEIYSDETNSIKSSTFINFGVTLKYKFTHGLSFIAVLNNILDRENYQIYNFEEKPLDAVVGVEYKW